MTARKWAPGDVAAVEAYGGERVAMVRAGTGGMGPIFAYATGGFDYVGDASLTARPLVVNDPEDRGAALEFANAIPTCAVESHCDPQECMSGGCWTDRVQAALRSLTNPEGGRETAEAQGDTSRPASCESRSEALTSTPRPPSIGTMTDPYGKDFGRGAPSRSSESSGAEAGNETSVQPGAIRPDAPRPPSDVDLLLRLVDLLTDILARLSRIERAGGAR